MIKQAQQIALDFLISIKRLFVEKHMYRASALSYTTLLAMVPLLSVIVSLLAIFPFFSQFINLAETYVVTNLVPTKDTMMESQIRSFVEHATGLPIWSFLFLLVTASLLILTVEGAIDNIWGTSRKHKKILYMMLYWLVLIAMPIFIGASVLLSTYLFSLSWFSGAADFLGIRLQLLASLPLIINAMIFSLLYVVVPNGKVRWINGLLGGLLAALLFELAKRGFGFYVGYFSNYQMIYGAFATIPIFLIWLYISWLIILFGAIFVNTRGAISN